MLSSGSKAVVTTCQRRHKGGGAEGAESELASIASMYVDKESLYIVVFSYVVSPKII